MASVAANLGLMFEHETFPNAPIAEAAVDFSVGFGAVPTLGEFARFGQAAADRFSGSRERRMFTTSLEMVNEEPIFHNTEHRFLAFSSKDEKYVAQIRSDGFAFSRLHPYTSWADFVERAIDSWNIYRTTFAPTKISSISLKYVNRIELPNPVNFDEYFFTGIRIAPQIPQEVSEAFFAFSVKDESGNIGRFVFAIDHAASTQDHISLVFNVEAVSEIEIGLPDDANIIPNILSRLRDLKNQLFFNSITEKLKGTFR
jgi:uncharacterized protein (TIGR04255 family)